MDFLHVYWLFVSTFFELWFYLWRTFPSEMFLLHAMLVVIIIAGILFINWCIKAGRIRSGR